jgi:hypothetical protein
MNAKIFLTNPFLRNVLGFLLLAAVHYASDQYVISQRTGFNQISPYLFLLTLYGWIVFHNRILFERLFLRGKRAAYFFWTLLIMMANSFSMYLILDNVFAVQRALPHILSYWVYTITGLGVYVLFRYLHLIVPPAVARGSVGTTTDEHQPTHFTCMVDGIKQNIPCQDILFVESLENYVKVNTRQKPYLVRLTLKEAEERLPKSFIRVSRSHILNTAYITAQEGEVIRMNDLSFRIGKVYKRYVEDQLRTGV